jgi:hypothetical protein
VRLHHAFFPQSASWRREKEKGKKMKEGSNNSDKMACPRSGDALTLHILTHYQQLPIKVKLSRLQVQPLIEKVTRFMNLMYTVNTFQYNRLALLQH